MAIDFDALIAQARKDGMSAHDIAEKFTDALNKSEEKSKTGVCTKTFEKCKEDFWTHVEEQELDYEDVVNLYILVAASDKDSPAFYMCNDALEELKNDCKSAVDAIMPVHMMSKSFVKAIKEETKDIGEETIEDWLRALGL